MDESVELFEAEQRRLVENGGPARAFIRQIKGAALSLAGAVVAMFAFLEAAAAMPRNADHSIKLAYYGPVLALMALGSAILLRRQTFRNSHLALAAWMIIALAVVAIPAGALDMLSGHGG